jgi:hypothetical protein
MVSVVEVDDGVTGLFTVSGNVASFLVAEILKSICAGLS